MKHKAQMESFREGGDVSGAAAGEDDDLVTRLLAV